MKKFNEFALNEGFSASDTTKIQEMCSIAVNKTLKDVKAKFGDAGKDAAIKAFHLLTKDFEL